MAPLATGLALRLRGALQDVAVVAHEADHVVQVESLAHGAAVDGAARVAAAHSFAPQNTGGHAVKNGSGKQGFGGCR